MLECQRIQKQTKLHHQKRHQKRHQSLITCYYLPAVIGGHICNDKERLLISLPDSYSRLGIPIFHETVRIESMNSSKIRSELTALIKQQSLQYDIIEDSKLR